MLHRYWLEFDIAPGDMEAYPSFAALTLGCGVTAFDYEDALVVLAEEVLRGDPLPSITSSREDVDVSQLDQNHVLPNIAPPHERGVWFPAGVRS